MHTNYFAARGCNTKRSLALEYFPEYEHNPRIAVNKLMRWINNCPELYRLLTELDMFFKNRRSLTVRQTLLIKEYLGEP